MKEQATERNRRRMIMAATEVLAREPGASMGRIAEGAGVGRATLHRHFPRREDLLREIALEAIQRTDAVVADVAPRASTADEYLRMTLEALVPLGGAFHFLARESGVMDDPGIAAAYGRQLEGTRELGEALKSEGTLAFDVPTAWFVATFDAVIYAMWSAVAEGEVAPKQAGALAYRTLTRGLGGPAPAVTRPAKKKTTTKSKRKQRGAER